MTQRDRVLEMLKAAGQNGVRSDHFIANYMPRAAARVQELKEQGYEISSEREGKYTRWTLLNIGVESDSWDESQPQGQGLPEHRWVTLDSGVAASPHLPVPVEAHARTIPSAYDCWEDAA